MKYDVLTEPWITVVTLDGKTEETGIRGFFEKAHLYRDVVLDSPLEVYAVQRMLIAFLMDAYSPERARDRKKLLQKGRFDMDVIDRYIADCRAEGVTFDLFDKERPFMQAPYDAELDEGKSKPAANLFYSVPSGNNHVHFEHHLEQEHEYSPAECLRGILALQLFAVSMAQGYPSSVNDTPCYYSLVDGNNLFGRMVLNMLSRNESMPMTWNEQPVAWRDTSKLIPKSEYADISILCGMTWQPRRITLIPETDECVRTVYLQQGRNFHQNGRWKDPHVSFKIGKKGAYTLKPEAGREPWRDIGIFALSRDDKDCIPSMIIKNMEQVAASDELLQLQLFGVRTSNAKIEGWTSDSMTIPAEIIESCEKGDRLRADMLFVEDVAKEVYKAVKTFATVQNSKISNNGWANNAQAEFFDRIHTFIFSEYLPVLGKADTAIPGWQKEAMDLLTDTAIAIADEIVSEYYVRFSDTARCLKAQVKAEQSYHATMMKLKKGRENQ